MAVGAEHRLHVLPAVRATTAPVLPDLVEQLGVAQDPRVEVELEHLGVIGEVVIRRIVRGATGVADAGADDRGVTPEPGVGRPESTEAERRRLERRCLEVERKHRHQSTSREWPRLQGVVTARTISAA